MDPPSAKRQRTFPDSDGLLASPNRPQYSSYQSPTRASLSRYHPSLLPLPRSSPIRESASKRPRQKSLPGDALKFSLAPKRKAPAEDIELDPNLVGQSTVQE